METYLISGWPFGTYKNEWDLEYAIDNKELWMADYVPLVSKIEKGNKVFLRKYGEGIFGYATVGDVKKNKGIYKIDLEELTGLLQVLPQDIFFHNSTNQNKRSRIIKIGKDESDLVLKLNSSYESDFMGEVLTWDWDAARAIEFSIQEKENMRYKTLHGQN